MIYPCTSSVCEIFFFHQVIPSFEKIAPAVEKLFSFNKFVRSITKLFGVERVFFYT